MNIASLCGKESAPNITCLVTEKPNEWFKRGKAAHAAFPAQVRLCLKVKKCPVLTADKS
jgi:hypothetical protein